MCPVQWFIVSRCCRSLCTTSLLILKWMDCCVLSKWIYCHYAHICRSAGEEMRRGIICTFWNEIFPSAPVGHPSSTLQPAKANPQMKCSGTSEKSSLYTFIKQQTWWKNIFKKHIINKYIFYNIYLTKLEEEKIIYYKMTRNNFLKVFFNIKYKTTVVYIFTNLISRLFSNSFAFFNTTQFINFTLKH